MSLVPGSIAQPAEDAPRIAGWLQRFAGVSTADLGLALERQRQGEMRFSEAVLSLGLATRAMVDAATNAEGDPATARLAKPAGLLRIAHDAFHPHSERIRALRTEIALRGESGALAVVGAGQGEGRSVLAAELAIAFAQLDQPTLLVDADLRRPRQHQLFNVDAARGLGALADGGLPAIHAVEGLRQLGVVTAGQGVANAPDLLGGPRFASLLAHWRQDYRHVVLDTPAAEGNADALILAGRLDAVLPIARRHRTALPALRALSERLKLAPARTLGAVLLDF